MPRLTLTLTSDRHRALKETALRRGTTIRSVVEESLDAYGVKTQARAAELVAKARKRSGLTESESLRLAIEETGAKRRRR